MTVSSPSMGNCIEKVQLIETSKVILPDESEGGSL